MLFLPVNGDLLEALSGEIDLCGVDHGALKRRSGHVLPVELELHDVRLRLLRDEADGVRVVALRLRTRRHLAVVHCKVEESQIFAASGI